jgi:hypothetical protein
MKRTWLILAVLFFGAFALVAQSTAGANLGVAKGPNVLDYVVDPNSVVFARTFSEWDSEWQQWAYSIPVANHPLFDKGDCTVGQSGPVWFLGGKFCANGDTTCSTNNVQRSCSIPKGKMIYFPVYNAEDSALEENVNEHPGDVNYQQIGYMRQNWDPWVAGAPPADYAIIDGVKVPHLENYKVQSTVFGFTIPYDNYLKAVYPPPNNFQAGTCYPAVDDGEYLMLAPLPPGNHTIQFGANFGSWGFNITYFIKVSK